MTAPIIWMYSMTARISWSGNSCGAAATVVPAALACSRYTL